MVTPTPAEGCRQVWYLTVLPGPMESVLSHTVNSNGYFNCWVSYCMALALTRLPTCCNTLHLKLNCPKKNVKLFPILGIFKAKLFEFLTRKEGVNWFSERMSNPVWPALTRMFHGRITGMVVRMRGIFCFSELCQSEVRPTTACEDTIHCITKTLI